MHLRAGRADLAGTGSNSPNRSKAALRPGGCSGVRAVERERLIAERLKAPTVERVGPHSGLLRSVCRDRTRSITLPDVIEL
jgi:hypothetical protein